MTTKEEIEEIISKLLAHERWDGEVGMGFEEAVNKILKVTGWDEEESNDK
jgi:hypothetical protein